MRMSAIIQDAEFRQKTVGVKEASADFDKMAESQRKAATAGEVLAKQQDVAEKSVTRLGSKLEAYSRQFDPIGKALRDVERGEALLAAARGRGVEVSDRAIVALENARAKYARLTGGLNDNSKEAAINRAGWVNLSRQLQDVGVSLAGGMSPLMVLTQQGSQIADVFTSSKGGATAALAEFGAVVGRFVLNPATLMVGTLGAIAFGASKASSALADLGKQTEKIGFSPSATLGANVVGARAGLTTDETGSALGNASKQFEAFQQNTGAVLSAIKLMDAGFLSTLDKARSLPQFVSMIGEEIRKLPPTEGMSLSKALLGDDAGKALFGSLDDLNAALSQTSAPLDEAAKYAADMQKQVDAAAQLAHNDLLKAFQDLTVPVHDLSLAFYSVESSIASAMAAAGNFYNLLRSYVPDWTSKSGFLEPPMAAGGATKLPDLTIGASRSRFAGYQAALKSSGRSSGKSDAEKEADTYAKITQELQNQIRLAESIGDAHKVIEAEIEKQNFLQRLGTNATEAHRDAVGALADKLQAAKIAGEEATKQQEEFIKTMDVARSTTKDFGESLVNAFRRGESAAEAMRGVLDRLTSKLIDRTLDTAIEGLLGKPGTNETGSAGGIIGSIAKLLPFSDGGIMTSSGPLALHTYASGGIAKSPQLALFGEGRTPEAYVPVPSGRIPVEMRGHQGGAKITINNMHGGAEVQARQMSDGEVIVTVQKLIDANNKKVPGIVENARRRSM